MRGLNPFGRGSGDDCFDSEDVFAPAHLPEPGPFLTGHDVLSGEDHVGFHAIAREVFEERGVYDMTFGYNLARLNQDRRHPDAGYRYARTRDDPAVVRAAFTPTTQFCPQAHTLAIGSFRAWAGLRNRYDYELVKVRIDPMHQNSSAINETLTDLEDEFQRTGTIPGAEDDARGDPLPEQESSRPF